MNNSGPRLLLGEILFSFPLAFQTHCNIPLINRACYSGQLGATKKLLEASDESLLIENIFSETPFHR